MNAGLLVIGVALSLVPSALSLRKTPVPASLIVALARATVPAGMVLVFLAMAATAAPAALRAVSLSGLAALCERFIAHTVFGGGTGALVGGVLTIALATSAGRGLLKARRDQANVYVDSTVGAHVASDCCTLVILPTDDHVAFSTPGSPPQLVVSRGTLTKLDATERRVVLEHERAHIRRRHFIDLRVITAASAALKWVPGIQRGLGLWREALEWQADDFAAASVGSRQSVAKTIRVWAGQDAQRGLGFGGVAQMGRRLAYIGQPISRSVGTRLVAWAAVGVLWIASASLVTRWVMHAHSLVLGLNYCPI